MTRAGFLASGAVALIVAGAFGLAADVQAQTAKRAAPLELKDDASMRPWQRYAGWPALRKLEYVDALLTDLRGTPPKVRSSRRPESLPTLAITLGQYYAEKRERYVVSYPDIYDRDLRRLFSDDPGHERQELASHFLRRNRTEIRRLVSNWTGEYQFTLEQVLKDMIGRSRQLKLRAVGPERRLKMEFAVLLTVKTMDFHYSRRNWFAL